MKRFLSIIAAFGFTSCHTQPGPGALTAPAADTVMLSDQLYNSAPFGLSMRERPDAAAPVISKVPYGSRILPFKTPDANDTPSSTSVIPISIDGMNTCWIKVRADEKTGYVIDAYVADYAPPPTGTTGIKEWAMAMARPYGKPFYGKPRIQTLQHDGIAIFRQLYDNGAIYSEGQGYEYSYQTLQLPSTSILKVYNCIKILKDFEDIFKSNATLKHGHYKIPGKGTDDGYDWNVEYEGEGNASSIKSITVTWSGGGYSTLSISSTDTEIIVSYSTGV